MYEERTYRSWVRDDDLVGFQALVKETDLFIKAERDLSLESIDSINEFRDQIEEYVLKDPKFQTTLEPYIVNGKSPAIVKDMSKASSLVGVGPFASVAGAIAEYVGKNLLKYSKDIIIENGGDIFVKSSKDRVIGIYAGKSSLNKKIGLEIKAKDTPLGICTSSGTVGHSLSFGKADAVAVLSKSTLLADAAATKIGNLIKTKDDIAQGIKFAKKVDEIKGVVIIKDDKIGVWGDVSIRRI
ncbi:UPF0280 family protein [Candidatus Omnitrophota bacterium]